MTSIVIAAHNEASVIGRCLDAILADAAPGEFDITVVPNGCTDSTAAVAAARGVRVVEVAEASKAAALNAGDRLAVGFPRIYMDADIVVDSAGVRAVARAVTPRSTVDPPLPAALAAVPTRLLAVTGRPWPVRAYFAVNSRLPAFRVGLFGRGMVAVSEEGRARFETFPLMVADDLFLDSLFAADEKACVDEVVTTVEAPRRTRHLVDRLVRVRRGNAAMRSAADAGHLAIDVRPADRSAWFRDVVRPNPRLAPAGVVYAVISLLAAFRAKRSAHDGLAWERDESTRLASPMATHAGPGDHEQSK
ncbi:MAG: glycosyltransferase [Dermatophilaceae bacterium]